MNGKISKCPLSLGRLLGIHSEHYNSLKRLFFLSNQVSCFLLLAASLALKNCVACSSDCKAGLETETPRSGKNKEGNYFVSPLTSLSLSLTCHCCSPLRPISFSKTHFTSFPQSYNGGPAEPNKSLALPLLCSKTNQGTISHSCLLCSFTALLHHVKVSVSCGF